VAEVGKLSIRLVADGTQLQEDVRKEAEKAKGTFSGMMQDAGAGITNFGRELSQTGKNMTKKVTLPIVGVGASIVMTAGKFEAGMNKVKAVTGAAGTEFDALSNQAKELGRTTKFTAGQAADAMGFLGMAGFDANEIMAAMPATLQLAAAANMDLGSSADIISNILAGYGLEVHELAGANDSLVKAMTSTNVDLSMLGTSFKYVGPIAKSAGLEFNETAAAIGLMGNAGIQGSMAGTALRGAITRMVKPTEESKKVMNELGLEFLDTAGRLKPLDEIVQMLEPHAENTGAMMQLFGQRAGPAMMALVGQGSEALSDLQAELDGAGGTAARIADVQMEGFNGQMLKLRSAAEGLMIAIAESGLLGTLTELAGKMTGWISRFAESEPQLFKVITLIGIFVAAIGPVLLVVGKMITIFGTLITTIGKIAGAMKVLSGIFMANPWMLLIIGIIIVVGLIIYYWDEIYGFVVGTINAIWDWLKENWPLVLAVITGPIGLLVLFVSRNFGKIKRTIKRIFNAIKDFFVGIFEDIEGIFQGVVDFVTDIWDTGFNAVKDTVEGIFNGLKDILNGIIEGIKGFFQGMIDKGQEIINFFTELPGKIGGFFTDVKDRIKERIDDVKGFFQGVIDKGQDIINFFRNMPGEVGGFFADLYARIKEQIDKIITWLGELKQKAIDALGPVGKVIDVGGRIIGGVVRGVTGIFRAEGGPAMMGRPYIVGEEGPELIVPSRSGTVIPADATAGLVAGGSGIVFNGPLIANATITSPEDITRLSRELARDIDRRQRATGNRLGATV
jgi:TP901 family phage tail tape measure protein